MHPISLRTLRETKLIIDVAIPGAPTETIDVKILEDSVHLTAPAKDFEYVSTLALGWPVKPDKAEATYENGLLRMPICTWFRHGFAGKVRLGLFELCGDRVDIGQRRTL